MVALTTAADMQLLKGVKGCMLCSNGTRLRGFGTENYAKGEGEVH